MGTGDPRSAAVIVRAHALQNRVEAGALTQDEAVSTVVDEFGSDPRALRDAFQRCSAHLERDPALDLLRAAADRVSPPGP